MKGNLTTEITEDTEARKEASVLSVSSVVNFSGYTAERSRDAI